MRTSKQHGILGIGRLASAGGMMLALMGAAMAAPACLDGVAPMLQAGKSAEALERMKACPAESAADPDLLLLKGRALTGAGRQEEALATFARLVETQPKSASALNNLAVVQAKLGRLAEARDSLEKAVAIAPDFALAQENLADVYVRLARKDYEKVAAKADPETRERVQHKLATTDGVLKREVAVAPPPVAAATPTPPYADSGPEAATAMVTAWAADWSAGNWTGYRGHYDAEFKPTEGRSFAAWESERQRRVAGRTDIRVTLSDIKVTRFGNIFAEARFEQSYWSGAYVDRGRKVLQLVRRPSGWRIVREAFEAMR